MVDKKRGFIALLVIIGSVLGYMYFFRKDTPEAQVRKRMDDLCTACSKPIGESAAKRVLKVEALNRIFANPVSITGDAAMLRGSYTPEELSSRIFSGSQMFETVRLSYSDLTVTITDNEHADVSFTAKVACIPKASGANRVEDYRQVAASLTYLAKEDRWVFTQFDVIRVMEK